MFSRLWCGWRLARFVYRFSAFWLRSKCSICSYQLNIWYDPHVGSTILIWFLDYGEVLGACSTFAADRPGIAVPPGSVHSLRGAIKLWYVMELYRSSLVHLQEYLCTRLVTTLLSRISTVLQYLRERSTSSREKLNYHDWVLKRKSNLLQGIAKH